MARKKDNGKTDNLAEDLKVLLESDIVEDVTEFVSTGCTELDYAIANRRDGGIPVGRITELIGENQAGKTLIATHILSNTQKKGGIAICIDVEHDMDKDFSCRVGVNWDGLIYKEYLESIEQVFDYIEKVIVTTRLKYKNKLITIVWDSVAATKAGAELEGPLNPSKYMGLHARLMSAGLRRVRSAIKSERIALVCTNQLRDKIGVMFGDPTTTPHGKALSFYASVRVKLKRTKAIKDTTGRIIGAQCEAKVIKSKVGPSWRVVNFVVTYDWGINDSKTILDTLCDLEVVTGKTWKYLMVNEKEHKFQSSGWAQLLVNNPEVKKFALDKLEEHLVIKFDKRPEDLNIDIESALEVEQIKSSLENN